MRLPTLLLLGATGMIATGLVVWKTVDPAQGAKGAATPATAAVDKVDKDEPAKPKDPEPTVDHSQFVAGKTLMMEGRLGHRVLPADTDSETFLFVDVSADADGRARTTVPLNLAIVIDRSGSMKGKRMDNAMAAARSAIQRLRDGDVVSLVTYNTAATTVISPTMIDKATRASLVADLDRPVTTGDTCISCGIETGMVLLGERPGMVSRILLLSDGVATAGVRDLPGFARIAESCRQMGASITTIGMDVDYDERVMAALARDSNGGHFFVENSAGLPAILDREMEALTRTIANHAELTVDLAPGVFAEQVYDRVATTNSSRVVVPLGAFTAGERKTVLVRLRVPRGGTGERPVAAVRLRYDDLVESTAGSCEGDLAAVMSTDPSQLTPLDGLVSARVSSADTSDALESANLLFREGRPEEARRVIEQQAEQLKERKKTASMAAPKGRGDDLSNAFDKQEKALDGATSGFADPPVVAPTASSDPARPSDDRSGKAQTRRNQEDAFKLDL